MVFFWLFCQNMSWVGWPLASRCHYPEFINLFLPLQPLSRSQVEPTRPDRLRYFTESCTWFWWLWNQRVFNWPFGRFQSISLLRPTLVSEFSSSRITCPYHRRRLSRNFPTIRATRWMPFRMWSWLSIRSTKYLRLYYPKASFIVFCSRPTHKGQRGNGAKNTAVNFEFDTFVNTSITKNATSSRLYWCVKQFRTQFIIGW